MLGLKLIHVSKSGHRLLTKKVTESLHCWILMDALGKVSVIMKTFPCHALHVTLTWAFHDRFLALPHPYMCWLIFLQEIYVLHANIASISQHWQSYASIYYCIIAKSPWGSANKNSVACLLTAWLFPGGYRHPWILTFPIMTDSSVVFIVIYDNRIDSLRNNCWGKCRINITYDTRKCWLKKQMHQVVGLCNAKKPQTIIWWRYTIIYATECILGQKCVSWSI